MTDADQETGFVGKFLRGMRASVAGNAQAFGFSITVTVTFGVAAMAEGQPSRLELFTFAMAAVAAFSLLNILVFLLIRHGSRTPDRTILIGTATDFVAVAAAVGSAIGITELLDGFAAWGLAPFVSGLAYVLVQSIELAVGRQEEGDD